MIVRTYTRRPRCSGRSCSDAILLDGSASSSSPSSSSSSAAALDDNPFSLDRTTSQDPLIFPTAPAATSASFSLPDSFPSSFDSDPYSLDEFSFDSILPFPPPGNSTGVTCNSKKPPKGGKNKKPDLGGIGRIGSQQGSAVASTSTLMEAQEFGEMMEHVDEVNFALDGMRLGQPVRIRRASLLSLLSVCSTSQRRRLLRAQGMAKRIIDAVLRLSFDDTPSTVAASALFYVLASDVQDDHLLDSPSCIKFLIKLLNPPSSETVQNKAPTIGSRLLGIHKHNSVTLSGINKRLDSSSTEIISKVQDILLSCKEIKRSEGDDIGLERPELSSKWIALLTMEKACLSTVSFEDTSGAVKKVGGNFKERLRELGGLDAIFNVAASCRSNMEGWLESSGPSVWELKDGLALQSVVLLLKCLKIMENATFLSTDNQNHLLGMNAKLDKGLTVSCVGLIIGAIKILSGLSLLRNSSCTPGSKESKSNSISQTAGKSDCYASGVQLKEKCKESCSSILSNDLAGCCGAKQSLNIKSSEQCQKRPRLSSSNLEFSEPASETTHLPGVGCSGKQKAGCTAQVGGLIGRFSVSANGSKMNTMKIPNKWISIKVNGSKMSHLNGSDVLSNMNGSEMSPACPRKRPLASEEIDGCLDDVYDPFAFDEDDLGPSKWEGLAKRKKKTRNHQGKTADKEMDGLEHMLAISNHEGTDGEKCHSYKDLSPSVIDEDSNLLEDCLLTAVKVLMNLTNDNPVGCQQIAASGGLDTMASLIISHFPSFDLPSSSCSLPEEHTYLFKQRDDVGTPINKHLNDHELDFLVAILGLLVNLVEKDSRNRSRLVSARVPVAQLGRLDDRENHRDVIPLLCSIFLANQGAVETAEEVRLLPCNEESALLQGEREAEMMIIEAYAALLLAFLSTESKYAREIIASCLPNHNLRILVPVLERFVEFHLSLNMISPETHSTVSEVIESCRVP